MYSLQNFDDSFGKLYLLSFNEYLFKIIHWIFIGIHAKLHIRYTHAVTDSSLIFCRCKVLLVLLVLLSCDKDALK